MREERLRVLYRLPAAAPGSAAAKGARTVDARAEAIALEQSVELPRAAVPGNVAAQGTVGEVESIEESAPGHFAVWVSYAAENAGNSLAQLLNVFFGNTSLQQDVTLADVELPPNLLARFAGPHFGIAGVRRLLAAERGPLTCTALKPVGLDASALADLCSRFAHAGIHVIKDDHSIAGQRHAPFSERVPLCAQAAARVADETGRPVLYAPHVSGAPATLHAQTALARDAGLRMVMIAPMLVGLPAFAEVVAAFPDMAFLAHPALGGAWRIAPELLFGKLFRLAGADGVIFVNYGGRFGYTPAQCQALAGGLRSQWGGLAPAFPVPSGGMTVARVTELLDFYGPDTMLLVSGDLFGGQPAASGALLDTRSRAFVRAARDRSASHHAPLQGGGTP